MILKLLFNAYIFITGRPVMQKFNEKLFRAVIGSLGYMNFSRDFKLTGEKQFLRTLNEDHVRVILDVGANAGQFARVALQETKAHVISFEPQKKPFSRLKDLVEEFPGRIEVFNFGLGDFSGETIIYVHSGSDELSFIDPVLETHPLLSGKSSKVEVINVKTLDDIYLEDIKKIERVDFLKIDTEGYELEVIIGANRFINAVQPKYIQVEINHHQLFRGNTLFEMSKILFNYEVAQLLPHGNKLYLVDPKSPIRNIFSLSNFVFIRRDTE